MRYCLIVVLQSVGTCMSKVAGVSISHLLSIRAKALFFFFRGTKWSCERKQWFKKGPIVPKERSIAIISTSTPGSCTEAAFCRWSYSWLLGEPPSPLSHWRRRALVIWAFACPAMPFAGCAMSCGLCHTAKARLRVAILRTDSRA